ncbi:MAG: peptidoglycan-binding domain-containing protein [Verrucomicrobiota bacterium]
MKPFLTILLGSSLAFSAMAQQDEDQQNPKKDKKAKQEAAAKPEAKADRKADHGQMKAEHAQMKSEQKAPASATGANASAEKAGNANVNANATANQPAGKQNKKERAAHQEAAAKMTPAANASAAPAATAAADMQANKANAQGKNKHNANAKAEKMNNPAATPAASVSGQTAAQPNAQAGAKTTVQNGTVGKEGKKADVQAIKTQHVNFHAQARPQQIPTVSFNQGYRISGAEQWQGPQYEVFRAYQPVMHDQGFYRSRYDRVEVIGGGAYYLNNGYWYPAWGYDNSAQYYPYDGPIYVGRSARTPDQVIADVQSALQQMGYYRGEVDGLMGPMTREALGGYQSDHQLYSTSTIDAPTLDALGLS